MHVYSLTDQDMAENTNIGKCVLLNHLLENKVISEEVYNDYYNNYAFMVVKRSYFSKFWEKFIDKEDTDKTEFILVKQVSMKESENGNQKKK